MIGGITRSVTEELSASGWPPRTFRGNQAPYGICPPESGLLTAPSSMACRQAVP